VAPLPDRTPKHVERGQPGRGGKSTGGLAGLALASATRSRHTWGYQLHKSCDEIVDLLHKEGVKTRDKEDQWISPSLPTAI
jgi:hypothetical protein